MTEARLVKGHACDNCGEPMVAHCSRHVIPCCPHYPQHEPAAAPAEGLSLRIIEKAMWRVPNLIGDVDSAPALAAAIQQVLDEDARIREMAPQIRGAHRVLARQGEAELGEFRHHESAGSE